jgi:multidrug resistance efflux pump
MEYSELKAPYDLIVVEPKVARGQTVINQYQAVPLVLVADLDNLDVDLVVKPSDLGAISLGKAFEISINDKKVTGQVVHIAHDADGDRIRVKIRVNSKLISPVEAGHLVKVKW